CRRPDDGPVERPALPVPGNRCRAGANRRLPEQADRHDAWPDAENVQPEAEGAGDREARAAGYPGRRRAWLHESGVAGWLAAVDLLHQPQDQRELAEILASDADASRNHSRPCLAGRLPDRDGAIAADPRDPVGLQ